MDVTFYTLLLFLMDRAYYIYHDHILLCENLFKHSFICNKSNAAKPVKLFMCSTELLTYFIAMDC